MSVIFSEFEHGYVVTVRGYVTADVAREIVATVGSVLSRRSDVYAFQDWFEVTGYEPRARLIVSDATVRYRRKLKALHVGITRDPMISMGASVINVVVNGFIDIHKSRESFTATQVELLGAPTARPVIRLSDEPSPGKAP